MRLIASLTLASLKMYFRQREAILWSLILPLFMVLVFGFLNFDGSGALSVGFVNNAGEAGERLKRALESDGIARTTAGRLDDELGRLKAGDRDLVVVVPGGYPDSGGVRVFGDPEAKPREVRVGALVVRQALQDAAGDASVGQMVEVLPVVTRHLRYTDFLVPGLLAMSIMQLGVFGVAFGFVSLKKRGILRRLSVTPMHPAHFITAQVLTRLVALAIQMVLLLGVGVLVLDLRFTGGLLPLIVMGGLGAVVFLAIGFAIAGVSRSEDQVAPLANIITIPMVVLSGVFFSRTHLPGIIHTISDLFPLTFLADGLRAVVVDGAGFSILGPELGGITVWAVLAVALASRLFRWE